MNGSLMHILQNGWKCNKNVLLRLEIRLEMHVENVYVVLTTKPSDSATARQMYSKLQGHYMNCY